MGEMPRLEIVLDEREILRVAIRGRNEVLAKVLYLLEVLGAGKTERKLSREKTRCSCNERDGSFTLPNYVSRLEEVKVCFER